MEMIEYNSIALCCCYAKSALSTETPSTTAAANRPSQHSLHCIKNLGSNVKFCPQETQKIRTNIYGLQTNVSRYVDRVFARSTYSGCIHFQIFKKQSTIFKIFTK